MCIPNENFTTSLVKYKRGVYGSAYIFGKVVAPLKCKKTVPTRGRECLFAARFFRVRQLEWAVNGNLSD